MPSNIPSLAGHQVNGTNTHDVSNQFRPEVKYFPAQKPHNISNPVKVIIVGAGIGGTVTALLLSKKIRNITLYVYDRNAKIVSFPTSIRLEI